jgi:hypothetical protein
VQLGRRCSKWLGFENDLVTQMHSGEAVYAARWALLPAGVLPLACDRQTCLSATFAVCRRDDLFNVTCKVAIGGIEDTSQPAPCTATASAAAAPTLPPTQTPALLALKL